jgi:hypothetical protein
VRLKRFECTNAGGGVTHVWVRRRTLTGTTRLKIAMVRKRQFRRLACPDFYTKGKFGASLNYTQSLAALQLATAGMIGP